MNSSSSSSCSDVEKLLSRVSQLKYELKKKDSEVSFLETELRSLQRKLDEKNEESSKKDREIHKLRSVLQISSKVVKTDINDLMASLSSISSSTLTKKHGVSGQSLDPDKSWSPTRHEKDFCSKQLIKEALFDNDFLKKLSGSQVREIVDVMESKSFEAGSNVIKEGDSGSHLYVSAEGSYEVFKNGQSLGKLGVGKAFGELAILYNCKRTATIKALTNGRVWCLKRRVFQEIMMRTGVQELHDDINFLTSVPIFRRTSLGTLVKLSDASETNVFSKGSYIIRQGTVGDTFYIIREGQVNVSIKTSKGVSVVRILNQGDYFGEQALLKSERRTANVIASSETVNCLCLDQQSFLQLVGDFSELKNKSYVETEVKETVKRSSNPNLEPEYHNIALDDLNVQTTLGVGGFGRVELVTLSSNPSRVFALKCLKKQHIVETHQQEHVFSEKKLMMSCRNKFIARLFCTFKDSKYVYFLMEACLGGELWTILRDKGYFDNETTRFYIGCVIKALEYLHQRNIIYRDLKPENLLLDHKGIVKMVDFGFSKKLPEGKKTWTFCGTPEYVAPEIILNKGHDRAVDFWSLGVLIAELLIGIPPFTDSDPMKIYNIILRGIERISFPKHVTRSAILIIKKFCKENPSERLGVQKNGISDIQKQRWFHGFDWESLDNLSLRPPFIPKISSPSDVSNFDSYPRDEGVPRDELSGWDELF